jgi:hypothetical protein
MLTKWFAAALNVVNEGWDGRVLMCEEMPDDAPKGPAFWDFNKTEADVEYVVSRKLQEESMVCSFSVLIYEVFIELVVLQRAK